MMRKCHGLRPVFGGCRAPVSEVESAQLGAEGGLSLAPDEAASVDAEDTIGAELTLSEGIAEREASRLAAARRYQFEKELEMFVKQAGGVTKPGSWAQTRKVE